MASSSRQNPDDDLVTAVGRYVLGEVSLGKAAGIAGLSRWEFEEVLQEAGVPIQYGPRTREEVVDEVDTARDIDE